MKNFGLILKKSYVYKEDDSTLMEAIAKYEAQAYKDEKEQCSDFDIKVLPRVYKRSGEDKIYNDRLFAQLNSGVEYKRVYVVYNSKIDSDWFRENAYPKEDRYDHKSIPERFADEYHIRDNRIQTPEKFGDVDGYLHWFCSRASKVDVAHIDMSTGHVQAYSVSDEYFKPVEHFKKISPRTDAWSKAAGYPRRETITFLMWTQSKRWDDEDRLAFVNSINKNKLGATPDTQVVKCPVCGKPAWAAPASVGSVNTSGKFVPEYEYSKQMTCEHCGADLSPCFDIDYSIPPEKYFYKEQDEESDVDDIFESIAELQTEINIKDIDCNKVVSKARARAKVATKPWLVRKNNVPEHKVNNVSEIPSQPCFTAYNNCPAKKHIDIIREAVKNAVKKPAPKRRIQPLTPEQNARVERIAKAVKSKATVTSSKRVAPGATIDEIRAMQK